MNQPHSSTRQIFVFTAGDPAARAHLDDSIRQSISLELARTATISEFHPLLEKIHEEQTGLYAWGAVPGKMNNPLYRAMKDGDWVLCSYDKTFHYIAQVINKVESRSLAEAIWGTLPGGETWELVYFLTRPQAIKFKISETGGYFPDYFMGFSKPKKSLLRIIADYGSVDQYIEQVFGAVPYQEPKPMYSLPPSQTVPIDSDNQHFIIRSDETSAWADKLGEIYHFGEAVPNQKKLRKGGYVIVDRKTPGKPYVLGWGQLAPAVENMALPKDKRLISNFLTWNELQVPRPLADDLLEEFHGQSGYNAQFAVRPISKKLFEKILDEMKEPTVTVPSPSNIVPYTVDDAIDDLFIDLEKLSQYVALFKRKKNLILQGPPGVGKTYFAQRLARLIIGNTDPSRCATVQFHQSLSYEDFIQGYRPTEGGGFQRKSGAFYAFCKEAAKKPQQPFVFVIDEINRGNLSKIFGELMLLIEADKRGPDWALPLTYSTDLGETFFVPENVYILGMMNTADRSLAMVDYALRRRFVFLDMEPALQSNQFGTYLQKKGCTDALVEKIRIRIGELNERIDADRNLGKGFLIGHSYFTTGDGVTLDDQWYEDVIHYEISPLVREYWFDRTKQEQDGIIEKLLA